MGILPQAAKQPVFTIFGLCCYLLPRLLPGESGKAGRTKRL